MGWVYLFMGIVIGSAVLPIVLCLWWVRMTSVAMVSGAVGGTVIGLIFWLITASQHHKGVNSFYTSTGRFKVLINNALFY